MSFGRAIRRASAASAWLAVLAAVNGCGSVINLGDAVAQVHGAIYYVDGRLGPNRKAVRLGPERGTITIVASNGKIVGKQRLEATAYGVGLQTGTYTFKAVSDDARCPPVRIHVQLGTVRHLDVICTVV